MKDPGFLLPGDRTFDPSWMAAMAALASLIALLQL